MCGEKSYSLAVLGAASGSPPRVRGKVYFFLFPRFGSGITPACAGKREQRKCANCTSRDHPRVCGEKGLLCTLIRLVRGSPPRVRGKECRKVENYVESGITPACAGKSESKQRLYSDARDHPRVCGEKEAREWPKEQVWGSPPRVRGKD